MNAVAPLSSKLLAFVIDRGSKGEGSPELEAALALALAGARKAWPNVVLDEEVFLRHLAEHLPDGPPAEAVERMHTSDLYLACACAKHDARALASFDARFLCDVGSFVAQIDRSPAFADEARQQLREKLLVPAEGERAKIAEYSGKGPLGGWLRVASVRTALNMRRGKHGVEGQDVRTSDAAGTGRGELLSPGADPELDYMKTRYSEELRSALETTLAGLSLEERTVLRMHYVDRLNIEQIGLAYHVHRATAARWISVSREKILKETKRLLSTKLEIGQGEVESMIGLVRSQLDVSIYRLLDGEG